MFTQTLTLIFSLVTIIFGTNSILGVEGRTLEEKPAFLSVSKDFDFETGDQTDLNNWVARNGAEIYQYLNNRDNIGYPAESKNLQYKTESEDWVVDGSVWGHQVDFIKKKEVPASKAIQSLLTSGGQFDCRIAQRIVFLECMRRLMGDVIFDRCAEQFESELSQDAFATKGETRKLHLCGDIVLNPYMRLTTSENNSLYTCGMSGYFGYIPNIEEYAKLHPHGFLRGDHGLICSTSQQSAQDTLYVGFGSVYKNGGIRWDNVVGHFKEETLTEPSLETFEKNDDQPSSSRAARYNKIMSALREAELQTQKDIAKQLQHTFEGQFIQRQIDFKKPSASYFVNINLLKTHIKGVF